MNKMQNHGNESYIGISKESKEILEKIDRFLPLDIPILLLGNAGTGKDLLASTIHSKKNKKVANFYKIDCANLEVELDMLLKKLGKGSLKSKQEIPITNTTFYFDSLHHANPQSQNILLKLIESLSYTESSGKYNFLLSENLLIFSSYQEIKNLIKTGVFREDLYSKFGYKLILSDLKDRKEDIPPLVNHYLNLFNSRYKKSLNKISEELRNFLLSYHWPGNVNQLKNLLEGMVALLSGKELSLKNLPESFYKESPLIPNKIEIIPGIPIVEYEKEIIKKNLEFVNYNRAKAAKLLGISERNLYRKIIEYKL